MKSSSVAARLWVPLRGGRPPVCHRVAFGQTGQGLLLAANHTAEDRREEDVGISNSGTRCQTDRRQISRRGRRRDQVSAVTCVSREYEERGPLWRFTAGS